MATQTVDPVNIPKRMTRNQLEAWVLFGILVANKEAAQTQRKLDLLFEEMTKRFPSADSPFALVRSIDRVPGRLRAHLVNIRTGQYTRIERAFREASKLDVNNLTLESLEAVHGIGPKTARMTLLYSEPESEVVPLDTHVLKYLRKLGYENVPKNTPPAGPTYRRWEQVFVEEAHKAGMSVRDFDTYVWKMYAKSTQEQRG